MQPFRPQLPRLLAAALIALALLAGGQPTHAGQAALTPEQQAKANAALLGLWGNERGWAGNYLASKANIEQVSRALADGADVNASDATGYSTLMWASAAGDIASVQLLVSLGADVHATDQYGDNPLAEASKGGRLDCVKFLVSKGVSVNSTSDNSTPILMWAVQSRSLACVKFLIDNGARRERPGHHTHFGAYACGLPWYCRLR